MHCPCLLLERESFILIFVNICSLHQQVNILQNHIPLSVYHVNHLGPAERGVGAKAEELREGLIPLPLQVQNLKLQKVSGS